jgi:hypothetical protein
MLGNCLAPSFADPPLPCIVPTNACLFLERYLQQIAILIWFGLWTLDCRAGVLCQSAPLDQARFKHILECMWSTLSLPRLSELGQSYCSCILGNFCIAAHHMFGIFSETMAKRAMVILFGIDCT